MKQIFSKFPTLVLTLIVGLMTASSAFGSATIVIQNNDGPGVGFNDPTAATPVGGNNGTTVGQQRLNAFQFAADIWGATLTSGPVITIRASWSTTMACTTNSGTLGTAGATSLRANFPNAPFTNTWYGVSLANALANSDLNPGTAEINAQFNARLGQSGCLQNSHWYYGFDNNHGGSTGIDLVTVLLHEFSHGFGFQSFTDEETGAQPSGFPSVYDRFLFDNSKGKTWVQMNDSERVASAINSGNLAWNGARVDADAVILSSGKDSLGRPLLYTPNPVSNGSSVSHWDMNATPNQLMEPNISSNLTHSVTTPQDLTFSLLRDIGWCSGCPQPPPPSPTPTPSPPPNNNFANAQLILGCTGSVVGTNIAANKETNEPSHEPDGDAGGGSVWYRWQAPSSGNVTMTTAGSNYDTLLAVYTGNGFPLTAIVKNDDVDPNHVDTTSSVVFSATAGTVYKIAVDGWGGDTGNIVLNWTQSNCVDTWQPTTLTNSQVDLKAWKFQGRSYAYVKLSFPNAGYRVSNWGQPVRSVNDFSADAVVEKFTGASVQAVTTTAQIYDLGPLLNGNYTFTFKNSGTVVKALAFSVTSAIPPPNPIDDAREFVKQQYRDFLNREADQAGEDFWTDNITKCSDPSRRPAGQTEAQCTLRQRETTSGAFFESPEFQYTGYYVYRMYKGALNRQPKLSEFTPDALFVGAGIIVNGQLSGSKINQNKADFAQQFVNCTDPTKYRCSEFKNIYDGLSNQQYVDKLFQTTGVTPTASEKAALVNGLNANPATETRASVLQKVVDGINVISEGNQQFTTTYGHTFYNLESNRAFVQLEYFGYMKRDPDDLGYAFWLGKLNQFNGDFVNAEMVLAFITSPEYRARFGQP